MKVTIISTYDTIGGAGIAAIRLMDALNDNGADTQMMVQRQTSTHEKVQPVGTGIWGRFWSKARFVLERLYFWPYERDKSIRFLFSPTMVGTDISQHPLVKEADVIHLHWINHGYLTPENIAKLANLNKPIVWTLHDMWAFTGGCHYSGTCEGYLTHCGNCPFLKKPVENDLSHHIWHKKKRMLKEVDIQFVTCSEWLRDTAKSSSLLKEYKVEAIPNGIDTNIFTPMDKSEAKQNLGLDTDKKYMLFGALNVSDERKGFNYFKQAVELLLQQGGDYDQVELLVFGKTPEATKQLLPLRINDLGTVSDAKKIAAIYNAAETFVLPSLEDNLPNTIMEAMACGTPCVAFTTGGIPEMIDHESNGYLAAYRSSEDLAEGLKFILDSDDRYVELSKSAREKVLSHFSPASVAERHISLYQKLLDRQ